jgi:tRNA-Thr(GGU) m(6)t(6)A37 methyltransferase TsaA
VTASPPALVCTPIGVVALDDPHPATPPASQAADAPDVTASVTVRDDLVPGLLGLDRYPWVWLVTWLHDQPPPAERPLQMVPRATEATGEVQGVFASRFPLRPNPIGLHLVRLLAVTGPVVAFAGVDLVDGTPVLDIKPWFADCDLPADT